jgi:hypothetical protein
MATALIWNDDRIRYDFGPHHPLKPIRVELTVDAHPSVRAHRTPTACAAAPGAVHRRRRAHACTRALRRGGQRLSADPEPAGDMRFGLGLGDNPVFAGMHEASLEVCGASVAAAQAVWEGRSPRLQPRRRAASRHARPGRGVLHLRRSRVRDRLAAAARREPGRLHRRRHPPRRRRPGVLLRRPACAHVSACTSPAATCSPARASPTRSARATAAGRR